MTEETKGHVLDIIAQLTEQYIKIERLVCNDAMQDYSDAVEAGDMDARMKAFKEMECYTEAYAEVRKATKILYDVRGGIAND